MKRTYTCGFAVVAAALAGGAVLACSDDSRVISSDHEDAAAPPASTSSETTSDGSAPPPAQKPPFDPADESVACAQEPCAVELVAGENHFCARMSSGAIRCWGANGAGVLGRAPSPDDPPSVGTIEGPSGTKQLSAGGTTTCALASDDTVHCWGNNSDGLLGLQADTVVADGDAHPSPTPVALPGPAVRVDIGPRTGCAILAIGQTWCWGYNGTAQLGRPTTETLGAPALTPLAGLRAVRTAHGSYTSLAVTEDGEVVSWGTVGGARANLSGRMASMELDPNPLSIGLGKVTRLAVSSSTEVQAPYPRPVEVYGHACAVAGGDAYCWGRSQYAALGTGSPDISLRPQKTGVETGRAWIQQVAVGGETTCIRLTNGAVQCAGDNRFGTLGIGDDAGAKFSMAFRPATELDAHAVGIAVTRSAVCALLKTGQVTCWGANDAGQLGQGTKDDEPHGAPVTVKF